MGGASVGSPADAAYSEDLVRRVVRLSNASVGRGALAYEHIDWDAPDFQISQDHGCWCLPAWDPIGSSDWYRALSDQDQAHVGLYRACSFFKVGIEFETVLIEGLLDVAAQLSNKDPLFRYIYHEIAEEVQHSMLFQEFINRSAIDVPSSPADVRANYRSLLEAAHELPEILLFAAFVGEEVFDHLQRRWLASTTSPLLHRIYQLHIADEARHLAFVRAYLRERVPQLRDRDRRLLRFRVPFLFEWMTTAVFGPDLVLSQLGTSWEVPEEVDQAIRHGPVAAELRRRSAQRAVALCHDLDLVDERLATAWSKVCDPNHRQSGGI